MSDGPRPDRLRRRLERGIRPWRGALASASAVGHAVVASRHLRNRVRCGASVGAFRGVDRRRNHHLAAVWMLLWMFRII